MSCGESVLVECVGADVFTRIRQRILERDLQRVAGLSIREAAMVLGVPASRVYGERTALLSRNHAYAFA